MTFSKQYSTTNCSKDDDEDVDVDAVYALLCS